jgi:putative transposase
MSIQRFTPEFKAEAVRQVVDRGYSVAEIAARLGVSTHKPISDREQENNRLLRLIRDSYATSQGVYGARRVFGDLREAGESCGKHRVARLMRAHKIKALQGYKAPRPIAGRPSIIASNHLNREFTVEAPNKAWMTDITYIRTW